MKKEFKAIWWTVAVLAVLQLVGGIIYTSYTAKLEREFTYVECTVTDVQTKKDEDSEDKNALIIERIVVTYKNSAGETVDAEMTDYPQSFAIGTTFTARYTNDPHSLSAEHTDWFTPIFLIVLGAVYAITAAALLIFRKHTGLYAMESPTEEYEESYHEMSDEHKDESSPDAEGEYAECSTPELTDEYTEKASPDGQDEFADNSTSAPNSSIFDRDLDSLPFNAIVGLAEARRREKTDASEKKNNE